jgi:hypothetical protein
VADARPVASRDDSHDNGLDAARGIAIAVLLALPIWGVLFLLVRWLLSY